MYNALFYINFELRTNIAYFFMLPLDASSMMIRGIGRMDQSRHESDSGHTRACDNEQPAVDCHTQ